MKKNIMLIAAVSILILVSLTILILINKRNNRLEIEANVGLPRTKLFNIEHEEVANKFELNYSNLTITAELDSSNVWHIIEPVQMKADASEAFANVKNFNTLIFDAVITNMNDMEVFGVDNPKEEYKIWEGEKVHTVYVGNKTLDDLGYYVKYNNEIFRLEEIYIMALRKSIKDLRDKDFMKINEDSVVSINIDNKISMKKLSNDSITMNDNKEASLIKVGVGFLLFSTLKAIDFTDSTSMKDYGFDKDARKITLYLDDKSELSYLLSKVDVHVYAKLENDDVIYEVNPNAYNNDWYDTAYYMEEATKEEEISLTTILNATTFMPFDAPQFEAIQ